MGEVYESRNYSLHVRISILHIEHIIFKEIMKIKVLIQKIVTF